MQRARQSVTRRRVVERTERLHATYHLHVVPREGCGAAEAVEEPARALAAARVEYNVRPQRPGGDEGAPVRARCDTWRAMGQCVRVVVIQEDAIAVRSRCDHGAIMARSRRGQGTIAPDGPRQFC